MASTASTTVTRLRDLVPLLHRANGFADVLKSLIGGHSGAIDGAWGSSCALAGAALADKCPGTLLVVLPRIADTDDFADDFAGFNEAPPVVFPAWESLPEEHKVADTIFGGRLRVLQALGSDSPPKVIVTSLPALLQPVPSRIARTEATKKLRVGDELEIEPLISWLVERGFERVSTISTPGELSLRGGILDIFPPDSLDPVRVELFGDEIESLRRFDAETQRKVEDLQEIELTFVTPDAEASKTSLEGESLLESLTADSWVMLVDVAELTAEGKNYLARLDDPRGLYSVESVFARATQFPSVTVAGIAADSMETSCHLQVESIERFSGLKSAAMDEFAAMLGQDEDVLIACHNEGERERMAELVGSLQAEIQASVHLCLGRVTRGFRLVRERLVIVGDHELFGRSEVKRAARRRTLETRAIDTFLELTESDLVVHLTHGIGRYRGMQRLEKEGQVEEHLLLEFRDGVLIYVPASLIYLVQKYVGSRQAVPQLSKLGTTSWAKRKDRVAQAVNDLASDMIRLQAVRSTKKGIEYGADTRWQQEFEMAFPYEETADQLRAIADVKDDLQRAQPMDRLICGDVGYGKTEVAIRGAFKVVDAGRQVVVLVPTTVLAEQHFRTFSQRMAEYPVSIEVLSRFRTKGEQRRILEAMEKGSLDMVIGTHRLLQKDVRLKNLGLVIIDEEQRFGVGDKEMLKQLRMEVDVLTLSATPIPRTLHMSMLGIRDISNLTTPPEDRQSIETRIARFDPELIRSAIVRELNRNGQVYFVHNRVADIHDIADELQRIVPEATFGVGHGQMSGDELEDVMYEFVRGKTDVLVCTTIIESGLDIPNANTIFIHQGDRYGLADLHQLRGRVGRYKHRAYCYLLLEAGKSVTPLAAKRLKAVEEFSELGAGFKIAMRDLEIRGAGNILGTEQSGHISSVGYELYCQLLENAVRRLKNEPLREQWHVAIDLPGTAWLPGNYVPPGRQKIEIYRKLSQVGSAEALIDLTAELRDRFGPIPPEAERLLELKELQVMAAAWKIDDIHLEDKFVVFGYRDPQLIRRLAKLRGSRFRVVDSRSAYWVLDAQRTAVQELTAELKSVLQQF